MNRAVFYCVALFLSQYQIDPLRPAEEMKVTRRTEAESAEQLGSKAAIQQRKEFEKKFNAMIEALATFTHAYNKNRGGVWPAAEAKSLRNAILDVQKTETWLAEHPSK
jgi:hypothetical protein